MASITRKRSPSQRNASSSPPVFLPTPVPSQNISLPLRSAAFRNLAAKYNGVAADDNTEAYEEPEEDVVEKISIHLSTDDERKFLQHTPSGYEGNLLLGEATADERLEKEIAEFSNDLDREDFVGSKQRWLEIYQEHGYHGVARLLMEDEITTLYKDKPTMNEKDLHWTTKVMTDILESTYPRLLTSVMLGNLAYDRLHNATLQAILDKLWTQAKNQPGIYHQQQVNDKGLGATPAQCLRAAEIMMGYAAGCDHDFCDAIDDDEISPELANEIDNYMTTNAE
ncbi:hypothetical protein CC80DRAFT_550162 [Byssothecium circinans]|uniref:Uncharacterized protein n=1 Tax=Byssothecium circinans TaxID=147558 RepID=A0A6A5TPC7_9PLEO|nr:hypothetical protein CC80DRAFT_550162 [Byssothecium circinans]